METLTKAKLLEKYPHTARYVNDSVFEKFSLALIDEILAHNTSYIYEHFLNTKDVEKYLNIQAQFEIRTDSTVEVNPGDVLEVWSNNGYKFCTNAHIERCNYNNTGWTYVEYASAHFIDINSFSTSGGPWHELDPKELKYVGPDKKIIWTWGTCGARGNGGLYIPVKVNRYKIQIDRKYIPLVAYKHEPDEYGYIYKIRCFDKKDRDVEECFQTEKGFQDFLKNRNLKLGGEMFNGYGYEIIGDFDNKMLMSKQEYDEIRGDLPQFPKISNGEYTNAFYKDGIVYYCNPNVKDRDVLPYMRP